MATINLIGARIFGVYDEITPLVISIFIVVVILFIVKLIHILKDKDDK